MISEIFLHVAVYKYFDALDGFSLKDVWSRNACVFRDCECQVGTIVQQVGAD